MTIEQIEVNQGAGLCVGSMEKAICHDIFQAERSVGDESFLVHAGDTHIISRNESVHALLVRAHMKGSAEATLVTREVDDGRS